MEGPAGKCRVAAVSRISIRTHSAARPLKGTAGTGCGAVGGVRWKACGVAGGRNRGSASELGGRGKGRAASLLGGWAAGEAEEWATGGNSGNAAATERELSGGDFD